MRAREFQRRRYGKDGIFNAQVSGKEVMSPGNLSKGAMKFLKSAAVSAKLSGRALHRSVKVARTIADLIGSQTIEEAHVAEAFQFRASTDGD